MIFYFSPAANISDDGGDGKASAARRRAAAPAQKKKTTLAALREEVKSGMGAEWLPEIYAERVLTLRTRAHQLGAPAASFAQVEVQHTLLGVELKIGRRRLHCPDLTTARYLAAFARLGCPEVAVPYDITKVSRLADDLESSWHRMLLLVERLAGDRSPAMRSRLNKLLVADVRDAVGARGAGAKIPQFNQNTKQRPAAAAATTPAPPAARGDRKK